jgi:Zn-dependent protease
VANFWVSIAGVICNFAIAIVASLIIRGLAAAKLLVLAQGRFGVFAVPVSDSLVVEGAAKLLTSFLVLNIALGVFNLFPIPPLDGSKVLQSILPPSFEPGFEVLERFGFILLILAMFTGVFGMIFSVVLPIATRILFIGA